MGTSDVFDKWDGPQKAVTSFIFTLIVVLTLGGPGAVDDGVTLGEILTAVGIAAGAGGLTWAVPNTKRGL